MSFSNVRTVSVSVEKLLSKDGYGTETYDDPIFIDCRVQTVEELVTDQHGDEVRSSTIIYFYAPDVIKYEDKVTPPDGLTRQVVKVRDSPSIRGRMTLRKVWLK